ncbi:MAG: 3-deoxy-D-manno-octulosonic acid transferase, partial [Hydrogenimonas sp.]|nr:3-deoxy-D-manno-octulosonic acid transferase [Hydrogenimonas sp.]
TRHPERFLKVYENIKRRAAREGVKTSLWSETENFEADIVVVDVMGELVNFYAVSDIVILGGAFAPVGGHNPAEVVPFGCKLISGKEIFNQQAMFQEVEGAIFCDSQKIDEALERAQRSEPVKLRKSVCLDPILKGILDVV